MSNAPFPVLPADRRLPATVYILAALMALKAFLLLAVVAGASLEVLRPLVALSTAPDLVEAVRETPGASALMFVFAILLLLSVVGMLSRQRIGWLLAMVVTGLFVAVDIYSFINDGANHLWMVLNIVTVFYLNQRDVREVVGATTNLIADPAEATA